MAGEKILSETQCKNAKPKANVYYLNDGAGLRLRCRPDGSRTWVFRYRVNAKEKALGLGSYFQISSEKRFAASKKSFSKAISINKFRSNLSLESIFLMFLNSATLLSSVCLISLWAFSASI